MLLWAPLRPLILSPMNKLQLHISKFYFSSFHRSTINQTHYRRVTCSLKHWPLNNLSSNSCYNNIASQNQLTVQFVFGATTRKFSSESKNIQSARHYEKDNVGPEYTLIYTNSLVAYYRSSQLFLQPTVFLSIIGAGYLCYMSKDDFFLRDHIDYFGHPFVAGCAFFLFNSYLFYLITNISQCYLLRIYVHQNDNDFVAIVPNLFMSHSKLHFTANDITLSSKNAILPFKRGNSVIKGRSFILQSNDFLIPKYYDILHPAEGDDDDNKK